jgi:uncharacterized membrane protein YdjX (TVP38/TMEM64 family)
MVALEEREDVAGDAARSAMVDDSRRSPVPGAKAAPLEASGLPSGGSMLWRWAPLAAVAVGLALLYALDLHHYLSLEALRRYQASLAALVEGRPALAAIAYVAVYIVSVALSFPGASALTAAGGFMFGCLVGTALALFAATIGATLIFLIARTSVGDFLAGRTGPRMQRLRAGFQEEGFFYLLFLRLVPLFPFWLVNLAAALFGMRLLPFIAATAIGILPGTFVLSYLGEGLGGALDSDGRVLSTELVVGLALLGAMALIPVFVRRWRRGRRKEGAPG